MAAGDGLALSQFNDFVIATKPKKITPSTQVLNDATSRNFMLSDMLKGRGDDEVVQNGQYIKDSIQLTEHQGSGFYLPNETLQPRGADVLKDIKAPWRFHYSNVAYTQEQISLNGSVANETWVKLLLNWRRAMQHSAWESLERALWADPVNADMEADTGKKPYSILTFITEDGLAPAGFTTLMNLNPTTETNWRNQVEAYDSTNQAGTLLDAFDTIWLKLNWSGPVGEEWFTSTNWRKMKILTDINGAKLYTRILRASNDRLAPANDAGSAYRGPTFNGIPVKEIDALTRKGWTYPRFIFHNSEYMFPVFHTDRYMYEEDPIRGGANQPFSWALFTNTYMNLFCRSRKRQGIVIPE
jgi:hypothetical protein